MQTFGILAWECPCGYQGAVSRSGALLPSPPSRPLPSQALPATQHELRGRQAPSQAENLQFGFN